MEPLIYIPTEEAKKEMLKCADRAAAAIEEISELEGRAWVLKVLVDTFEKTYNVKIDSIKDDSGV